MKLKLFIGVLILLSITVFSQQDNYLSYEQRIALNQKLLEEVENGDTVAVQKLLGQGADVDAATYEGVSALMFSVIFTNYDVARMLVVHGADVNKTPYDGKTPLMEAAEQELIEIGELLILNKANLAQEDFKGNTAMHYAVTNGNYYFTEMLLFYEDTTEHKTKDGSSPLILAAYFGYTDICELLLQYGAELESKDNNGFTPLMAASQQGQVDVVKLLLSYGADTEIMNDYNQTAICYAVKNGHKDVVELLIDHGANYTISINKGLNLVNLADKYNHYDTKNYLKGLGVKNTKGFYFDKIYITNSINFSSRDALYNISAGLSESTKNFGIGLTWYKRFGFSPVIERDNDIYLQLYENRSLIGFDLFKDFEVFEITNITKLGIRLQIQEAFTYGKYKALERNPKGKFVFSPAVGIYYRKGFFNSSFAYQYLNLKIPEFAKSRYSISIGFDFIYIKNFVKEKYVAW